MRLASGAAQPLAIADTHAMISETPIAIAAMARRAQKNVPNEEPHQPRSTWLW